MGRSAMFTTQSASGIGIVAEAAGQARPGFLQLVAWIVIGALVVGEGFPVVGGHSIHTEEGQEGEQIKAHGKGPFLSLFGRPRLRRACGFMRTREGDLATYPRFCRESAGADAVRAGPAMSGSAFLLHELATVMVGREFGVLAEQAGEEAGVVVADLVADRLDALARAREHALGGLDPQSLQIVQRLVAGSGLEARMKLRMLMPWSRATSSKRNLSAKWSSSHCWICRIVGSWCSFCPPKPMRPGV